MSYCQNCGAKIEDDAKFCTECGTTITEEEGRVHNAERENKNHNNSKKTYVLIIAAVVACVFCILLFLPSNSGREANEDYPFLTNVAASSDKFDFCVDRAWATERIKCPEEMQEYYGSKYVGPVDENAIIYIVEFTFTNISNKGISERPIIRFIDSAGITYVRDEVLTEYTKRGGTSSDYVVYDEGVSLVNPMAPGSTLKGVCAFVLAKDWLDEDCFITCSLPQINANGFMEWLTGVNFGVEDEVYIPLSMEDNERVSAVGDNRKNGEDFEYTEKQGDYEFLEGVFDYKATIYETRS